MANRSTRALLYVGMKTVTRGSIDPALARDIAALAVPGLLIGHRVISPGDENALLLTS